MTDEEGQTSEVNFYPRPPRGGRPFWNCLSQKPLSISIHALREEGDNTHPYCLHMWKNFYPRPPRGGRLMSMPSCVEIGNFYPRPPRGGRRDVRWSADLSEVFLSTPSARRAT